MDEKNPLKDTSAVLNGVTSGKSPPTLEELIAEIDSGMLETVPAPEKRAVTPEQTASVIRGELYIRLFLEDTLLAVPISKTLEIGHRPDVTPLPNLPEWVLGVSNIRGEIVSIVDLKAFLGMQSLGLSRDCRLVIVHHQNMKVGLIVDRVMGIISLDRIQKEIQSSPYQKGEMADYIAGVIPSEDALIHILDVEKLLSSQRMNAFKGE